METLRGWLVQWWDEEMQCWRPFHAYVEATRPKALSTIAIFGTRRQARAYVRRFRGVDRWRVAKFALVAALGLLFVGCCPQPSGASVVERCEQACELREAHGCGYERCASECPRWATMMEKYGCGDEYAIAIDCGIVWDGACGGQCNEAAQTAVSCWDNYCGPHP